MEKMSRGDKAKNILAWAAMIVPPWNIFWWMVGTGVYYARGGKKNDPDGDDAWVMVRLAPIYMPVILLQMIREKRDLQEYERQENRTKEARQWVLARLKEKGLNAKAGWCNYAEVEGPLSHDETAKFQLIFVDAIQKFPDVPMVEICAWAKPLGLLDKHWAIRFCMEEYHAPQWTAPCFGCGRREMHTWRWGDDSPRAPLVENYEFILKPEFKEKFSKPGWFCKKCKPKYCVR